MTRLDSRERWQRLDAILRGAPLTEREREAVARAEGDIAAIDEVVRRRLAFHIVHDTKRPDPLNEDDGYRPLPAVEVRRRVDAWLAAHPPERRFRNGSVPKNQTVPVGDSANGAVRSTEGFGAAAKGFGLKPGHHVYAATARGAAA